jgi:hypothetical protein
VVVGDELLWRSSMSLSHGDVSRRREAAVVVVHDSCVFVGDCGVWPGACEQHRH